MSHHILLTPPSL
jgi:hypothetical protein